MSRATLLESNLRYYRSQHTRNIRERNEWLRIMGGRRTGQVMVFEHRAAQCRMFATEAIGQLRRIHGGKRLSA